MPHANAIASTETLIARVRDRRVYRLAEIDIVRGLVIILMALDHVRDFFLYGTEQDPMANPHITAGLFATRWLTHFCAPVFVLLAGTSAGLIRTRKGPIQLFRFLLLRGVWLIFVEVYVISTILTFSPQGVAQAGGLIFLSMQVIWAIGASMVALSVLQLLGRRSCCAIGVAILAFHNMLDPVWPASKLTDEGWPIWVALHSQMTMHVGPFLFRFAYPLLPWLGVMTLGFGISGVFEQPAPRRHIQLRRAGLALIAGFLVLRGSDIYGDANPWQIQSAGVIATVMDFLNLTKYPPSLDYLFMTLGPAAIMCSFANRMRGAVKDTLIVFGRVPFAFYVMHLLLIHTLSIGLGALQGFRIDQMMTTYRFYPKGYGLTLPAVYLVWVLVLMALYPFCRWLGRVKAGGRTWWLSYV